jgi:hypothetical protein
MILLILLRLPELVAWSSKNMIKYQQFNLIKIEYGSLKRSLSLVAHESILQTHVRFAIFYHFLFLQKKTMFVRICEIRTSNLRSEGIQIWEKFPMRAIIVNLSSVCVHHFHVPPVSFIFRFKCVISPYTFVIFWDWSLHFFLFGLSPCTL